ncbi:MAG: LLM class flavin-dependent oxidoreductase [Candidatus Hodarchaeales archaeon]
MKIGCYMPTFGGWIGNVGIEEPEISYNNVKSSALLAERIGLDSIWVADHLLNPLKGEQEKCLEAWTTLTALGAVTNRVKIAHTTLCQGFRFPAVLAKMASTLMELSNERFILSIGAGWFKREFDSYGAPWYGHDERVAQTEEQIKIIKSLWTENETNFEGKYYTIEKGYLEPKPRQIPQIWYGGESEASKELILRNVDVWLMYDSSPKEVELKIKEFLPRVGEKKLEYAVSTHVISGKTDDEAHKRLHQLTRDNPSAEERILKSGIIGSPQTIQERIMEYEKTGLNHLLLKFSQTVKDLTYLEDILSNWKSK